MEATNDRYAELEQMNQHGLTHINELIKKITPKNIKKQYEAKERKQSLEDFEEYILNNVEQKIKLLNQQFEQKLCLVRVVNGFDFPAVMSPNWKGDNLFILEDMKKINWNKCQYTEEIFADEIRIYFDIDIKHEEEINQIDRFEQILNNLTLEINDIEFYGIIEHDPETYFNKALFAPYSQIKIYENEHLNTGEKPKLISMHIYANYWTTINNNNLLMKYYFNRFFKYEDDDKQQEITNPIFDMSVYNAPGKRQAFRMSYSAKVQKVGDKIEYRPANENIKYDDIKDLILNLRCARRETDKEIPIDFIEDIKQELKEQEQPKATTIATITGTTITPNQFIEYSIFSFIKHPETDEIININTFDNHFNHWEFVKKIAIFKLSILKLDEIVNECNLIQWRNCDDTTQRNEQIIMKMKCGYQRNKENIKPLFTIKKYAWRYSEELERRLKAKEIGQEEYKTEKHIFNCVINKINGYIEKYLNLSFIHHNQHYNIIKTITDPLTGRADKINKILYNVFKDIDDNYYYCFNNNVKQIEIFNQKQFLNYFRLKPKDLIPILPMFATFKNIREYKIAKAKIAYKADKLNIDIQVLKLLELLKMTFAFEEDFKFYVGFLSAKVKHTYETLNKSIISQPLSEETGSGKDALKTYITDLLKSFIDIHKPEQSNLNKSLNGSYLDGNLCIIEEMPKEIINVNEFILRLKNYTATDEIEPEKKGLNAIKKQNKLDFIINSNHILKELFYNKNECEPMIKRFKILRRVSIDPKEHGEILDYFHELDDTLAHAYGFYHYLLNDNDYAQYFKDHRKDINDIERKYLESAVEEGTSDKIETSLNVDEFIKWFKSRFVDKNKCLRAKCFTDYFKDNITTMKTIKQSTLIYTLSCCDLITRDDKYIKIDDEQIKGIYYKYFEFVERDESEEEL